MPTAVCARPRYETMLTAIIAGLIHEGTMPAGSIVDSGAFRGEWACYYAKQDSNRTVYAIEPDEANIAHIQRAYEYLPNVRPVHAALGANAVDDVGWKDRGKLGLNLYPKQGQKENPSTNWSFPERSPRWKGWWMFSIHAVNLTPSNGPSNNSTCCCRSSTTAATTAQAHQASSSSP